MKLLDARTLPAPFPTAPVVGPVVIQAASHPLHGEGSGSYTSPLIVDAGPSYQMKGEVKLGGLGTLAVQGWVQGTGMIQNGRATGQLVLTGGHGTITLALHGPTQPGFSPVPHELVYSVTGGTGAYAHTTGYGLAHIDFVPASSGSLGQPNGSFHISFS